MKKYPILFRKFEKVPYTFSIWDTIWDTWDTIWDTWDTIWDTWDTIWDTWDTIWDTLGYFLRIKFEKVPYTFSKI